LQAIAIPDKDPQISGIVEALFIKLGKDKPMLNLGPDDQAYCENFALTVFARADKIDRAERADKNTAKAFYAASIFIEVSPSLPRLLILLLIESVTSSGGS
jgi:vacuolar protein sorting-associated protein VTA1